MAVPLQPVTAGFADLLRLGDAHHAASNTVLVLAAGSCRLGAIQCRSRCSTVGAHAFIAGQFDRIDRVLQFLVGLRHIMA